MKFKPIARVMTAAVASLALAACSSGGDGGSAKGGDLVVAMGGEPTSLDPLLVSDGQRDVFSLNVYEGLTGRSPDGEITPLLAESWKEDGTAWVFKIRSGVTFHDGSEMEPEDVVASYKRLLDPALESEVADSFMPGVKDVAVTGPDEVTITTEMPTPFVANNASEVVIVPAEYAASDDKRLTTEMVGTGPYAFKEWKRGQSLSVTRYEDYWGENPSDVSTATYRFQADPSVRLASLKSGEAQIAHSMPAELAQGWNTVISGPISEVMNLVLNAKAGSLTDIDLRRAIAAAIDQNSICQDLYNGYCAPASQRINSAVFGFNPDLKPYTFDLAAAKDLVAKAGGDADVRLAVPTGRWPLDRELGQVVEKMLTDAGFKVDAEYSEIGAWVQDALLLGSNPDEAPNVILSGNSNDVLDSHFSLGVGVTCDAAFSPICVPALDQEIAAASVNMDRDSREAAYKSIWSEVNDLFVFVPLTNLDQVHLAADGLTWKLSTGVHMYLKDIKLN